MYWGRRNPASVVLLSGDYMPLNTNALIEDAVLTPEVRKFYGIPEGLTGPVIQAEINEASDWIERETGLFFIQRAITDEEYFLDSSRDKIFMRRRPIVSVEEITDPSGTAFGLSQISIEKEMGVIWGTFWQSLNNAGLPAPWKFTYTAGAHADREAVPAALQKACKLVIAWRWKVNAGLENGDFIPRLIKESLTGFYAGRAA